MSRGRALAALSVLTAEQWGMVTAAQARWLGVSRVDIGRLLADGALELVEGAARVYRLAGCPPDPELDPLRGAWLQLGNDRPAMLRLADPDAVTSHRSAANALGLGDVIAGAHEFYVTRRHQPRRRDLRLRGWGTLGRELLLPFIAGISYELIRFAAKRRGSFLATLTAPGLWLQRITTKPPSDEQAAVAIHALEGAMALEESQGGELVIA